MVQPVPGGDDSQKKLSFSVILEDSWSNIFQKHAKTQHVEKSMKKHVYSGNPYMGLTESMEFDPTTGIFNEKLVKINNSQ